MRPPLNIDDSVLVAHRYLKSKIAVALVVAMIVIPIGPVSASDTATENPVAPKAYYGPKGLPGVPSRGIPDRRSGPDSVVYHYAAGYQFDTSWGSQAVVTVAKPEVGPQDYHTLSEIAVQSSDSLQIVEVGWTVDRVQFGDEDPHLFVYSWIDGVPQCYNGCGYIQTSPEFVVGQSVKRFDTLKIGIRHNVDRWSIEVKGEEIGYFPDSHWGGRYTESGLVQWFGEAVTSSDVPCSEIGNGRWAEQRRAAKFTKLFLFNGPPANVQEYPEQQYYSTEKLSNTAMRFGGPGGPC